MLKKININKKISNSLIIIKKKKKIINFKDIMLGKLVIKDMLFYMKIWRQVRGYSSNGQRSHSNNKGGKKNRILFLFRVNQFYKLFGRRKRDIFPTLILAEYNNRLWYLLWIQDWVQGYKFIFRLARQNRNKVKFDPQLLSKGIITGLKVKKKKKKHNVAKKKIILMATIGIPLLFYIYL